MKTAGTIKCAQCLAWVIICPQNVRQEEPGKVQLCCPARGGEQSALSSDPRRFDNFTDAELQRGYLYDNEFK